MTLKRANNYFHLGQQELQDGKGDDIRIAVEFVMEAQAIIKKLLASGIEITTKRCPRQLEFLRWWWKDETQRRTPKIFFRHNSNGFKLKK